MAYGWPMATAADAGTDRSDSLRRVRYQLGRCEDGLDIAVMVLTRLGPVGADWRAEYEIDLQVLRAKIATLANLLRT